jgi:hypothetical protein
VLHLFIVEPKLVQDGSVEVAVIVPVFDGLIAHVIGGPVDDPALHSAAGQQDAIALGVMIATSGVLRPGTAAELAAEYHQRRIEKAALLEVADQAGDGLIHSAAERRVSLHVAVRVPGSVAAAGVADLYEADVVLHQSARQQKLLSKIVRLFVADTVKRLHVVRLLGKVDHCRSDEAAFEPQGRRPGTGRRCPN